ncbi:MAG: nuclear transport factor 2 family protein [Acidobacteria bacterium]|nr:nuclear transport factor 2 family protein [Acidobacteriota bacterium]
MEDIRELETQLNALIAKGEMVEATELFYADDCIYQEGNKPPRTGGKNGHKEYLSAFFKTVTAVNGLTLHSQTIGDGVSMSEWTFDLATTNGPVLWNEVLRRRWAGGKVVSERFYTAA